MGKTTIYCCSIQWSFLLLALFACNSHQPNTASETLSKKDSFVHKPIIPLQLDHVNIAVADLEKAKKHYQDKLGFSLKPGRLHPNSILNAFAKFSDGSLIELITASEAKDELSHWYIDATKSTPYTTTFAAFGIQNLATMDSLKQRLNTDSIAYHYLTGNYAHTLSVNLYERFHTPFFIHYLQPVTDKSEYLTHENGASKLLAIWLPSRMLDRELFKSLGWEKGEGVDIPGQKYIAENIMLGGGSLYILPDSSDQRVIGVSLAVEDIDKTQEVLTQKLEKELSIQEWQYGRSIFLAPKDCLGLWVEFREQ